MKKICQIKYQPLFSLKEMKSNTHFALASVSYNTSMQMVEYKAYNAFFNHYHSLG